MLVSYFFKLIFLISSSLPLKAITGRTMVIGEGALGDFCSVIHCGLPLLSDLVSIYPKLKDHHRTVKAMHFMSHIEGSLIVGNNDKLSSNIIFVIMYVVCLLDEQYVVLDGYVSKSDWWSWFGNASLCVQQMTGCKYHDISCTERFAFQVLLRGPFRTAITTTEEKRIIGIPPALRHGIFTLPHNFAPRIDVGIHLRFQFHSFEQQTHHNDSSALAEVNNWINTTSESVFHDIELRLFKELDELKVFKSPNESYYVYVAADNEVLKDMFIERIEAQRSDIQIMRVDSMYGIVHAKNMMKLKEMTNATGVFDLAFDWYAMTLCNTLLTYRNYYNWMQSTFSWSASKVSGTKLPSNIAAPRNTSGIGTLMYRLVKARNGHSMWING